MIEESNYKMGLSENIPGGTKMEWKRDLDIPDEIWMNYIRENFLKVRINSRKMRITRHDDNHYYIECKYGAICQYSIVEKTLRFDSNEVTNKRIERMLREMPSYCKLILRCDNEVTISFPEDKLGEVYKLFKVRFIRYMSPENVAIASERLKILRKRKQIKSLPHAC